MSDAVFTQISKRTGTIKRVPRGEEPAVDLHLQPLQYVCNFEIHHNERFWDSERKTLDWTWTAWVVTPLPNPEAEQR